MTFKETLRKAKEYEQKSYEFAAMANNPIYSQSARKGIDGRAETVAQMAAINYEAAHIMRTTGCNHLDAINKAIVTVRCDRS